MNSGFQLLILQLLMERGYYSTGFGIAPFSPHYPPYGQLEKLKKELTDELPRSSDPVA